MARLMRGEEQRQIKHDVSSTNARERADDLCADVGGHVAP